MTAENGETMPVELAAALREHSPQLHINRPTLIRYPTSPTGWLLVVPQLQRPTKDQR
jgi:hypothetical protein